uniref:Uncharacterized protein n=1 Tax=viral metagenome TaxID=1070528 RepID=A0A6C0B614_9ZZZZ
MNRFLDKQYRISYNIDDLPKKFTVLDNSKSKSLTLLGKNLNQKNTQGSINIAIELVFSGYFESVIKKIIEVYIKNINLAQPRGILYISEFYKYYNNRYDKSDKKKKKIEIINDQKIKNFVSNLITLICGSNQRDLLKLVKISNKDFDLSKKRGSMVSKNLSLVRKYLHSADNKNIVIPLSEIITLLTVHYIKGREQKIIYWISWLLEYEKVFHKGNLEIGFRDVPGIENKYTKDFLWIIWKMLNSCVKSPDTKKYISSLEQIYKHNFTPGSRKKRTSLLILAILIYINPMPRLASPIPSIDPMLFKQMQYETLLVNIKYFALKKKLLINNL